MNDEPQTLGESIEGGSLAMEIGQRFGENLIIQRRRANLSQAELGVRASLHRTEISQLERGMRLARIDTLLKLAGAMNINPEVLLEGVTWASDPRHLISDPEAVEAFEVPA